ncbi:VMO1 protein, partial [Eubucco bourcierii]|nr:VMO1 protein [Eubucco bourcierii]
VEAHKGFFGDDSGLNGVKLFCDPAGTPSSSVGPRGSWLPLQTCPQRQPLVAFRLRVEPPRGVWDDVAASNLDAMCGDGTMLLGQGTLAGTWGNWSQPCPTSWGVCGIRTLLEPPQRAGDDTSLNDLQLFCCLM